MIDKTNWSSPSFDWAIGLLEGEGCFRPVSYSSGRRAGSVWMRVYCKMSDEDIIRKLPTIVGFGSVNGIQGKPTPKMLQVGYGANLKYSWYWQSCNQEDVFNFLLYLLEYEHLSEKKRKDILYSFEMRKDFELIATGNNLVRIFTDSSGQLLPDSAQFLLRH